MAKSLQSPKVSRRSPLRSTSRSSSRQALTNPSPAHGEKSPTPASGTRILVIADTPAQRGRLARGIAAELKRDLHRFDLGRNGGKYIGETEKSLSALFKSAEAKGTVLFFDEADALFGRRTSVKDAHDRYANLETSFLLAQIEHSRGVVVLATNNARKIDPAWMKRLRFGLKITSPMPDKR